MAIRDLARSLDMSYMGVKKPCLDLTREGYLKAMRKPGTVGRPELVYRLTEKGHDVFPAQSNELALGVLAAARELYGPAAAGKLLFLYFREKEKHYAARIRGENSRQRVLWFARERDKEGYLCHVENIETLSAIRLSEKHSPIADVMAVYPEGLRMEADMIERLVCARTRPESAAQGVSRYMRSYIVTLPDSPQTKSACQERVKSISSQFE